ncbi:MAG: thermonuclease family protein [Proteobacteria bacterium]|nr:thermonuclease family protein [Pseudomonadota bacterium]
MRTILALIPMILLCTTGVQAQSEPPRTIVGEARVLDGDTILVQEKPVRLYGISAPAISNWPWGPFSRAMLDTLVNGKKVSCLVIETDRNRNPVARCDLPGGSLAGGKTLGEAMIRSGWATHHRLATHGREPHALNEQYDDAEEKARIDKVGIWGLR